MTILDLIEQKKCGKALTEEQWQFFIHGMMDDSIADYQTSAFLMAICLKGMTQEETAYLTKYMAQSGEMLSLPSSLSPVADKHSTGGIGDKTTLIIAPILASCGITTAKMSGRGLGYTGGTIDKLESIEGFRTTLSQEEFLSSLQDIQLAIVSQTQNLAPADKKLYALRDVTGTVNSIPLIAASIMSKKLASGAQHILLDVKMGNGAFMKNITDAHQLAAAMVSIGQHNHRNVHAIITDMNIPLGFAVGNALEVTEAVTILQGKQKDRLYDLCIALCDQLISMTKDLPLEQANLLAAKAIENGSAYRSFCQMVERQGGKLSSIGRKTADYTKEITASHDGYITKIHSEIIGRISLLLGAGRIRKEDKIDPLAGIYFHKTYGDFVHKNEKIATLYTKRSEKFSEAVPAFESAITIEKEKPHPLPIIYETIK